MILYVIPEETDPGFCLAAEEYLLKYHTEDMVMIWQCHDTVVVGKHQNLLAEINYRYVREQGIRLVRRISGGGTVFHDAGNVNFTFLKNIQRPHEVSFQRFTKPVIGALAELGVTAESSGRNDLLAGGRKISGNAEHIYKNRVLHHGTLLFSSDLVHLGQAIHIKEGKYFGKAVESRRSKVANIIDFLPESMTVKDFMLHIAGYLKKIYPDLTDLTLPENEKEKIRALSEQKFSAKEWIFGYSPAYHFMNSVNQGNKKLKIELSVEKGIIEKAGLSGSYYSPGEAKLLEALLTGQYHLYESVLTAHQTLQINPDDELIYSYF